MILKKIISLANKKSELAFCAMVRSLRATGCNLPVWVIPFDNNTFELPENCTWWDMPEITGWVDKNQLWPAFKKIQCLTTDNYQFVDSDVIFFKDPAAVLLPFGGFITSCTHWNNPSHTYTPESLVFLKKKSTTWPKLIFNSGQWACESKLYETAEMIHFCETSYTDTLFRKNYLYKDQAGINLLVNYKNVPITNLTLPPVNMESTWAGDYLDDFSFNKFEQNDKPYLVHWAGTPVENNKFINSCLFKFLSRNEQELILSANLKIPKSGLDLLKEKARKTARFIKDF
jgi:hypothetical protein